MASQSPWKTRSRAVIRSVLASLPADATEKEVRAALRDAYPFGEREHHPYKMWLACVKECLAGKFSKSKAPGFRPVGYCLTPWMGHDFYLTVSCEGCTRLGISGCLLCLRHRQKVQQVAAREEFRALQRAAEKDDTPEARGLAAMALRDWLSEQGVDL